MEQWTGTVVALGKLSPACGPDSLGRSERLPFGQHWSASREMEAAAFGLQGAVPLRRIGLQFGINGPDLSDGLLSDTPGIGGFDGITAAHEEKMKKEE